LPSLDYIIWDFTRKCNLNCIYCYTEATRRAAPNELSLEQIREEVLPQFSEVKLRGLCLAGGEPLLRYEDILKIGPQLNDIGLQELLLATNGVLLTRKRLETLMHLFEDLDLFIIGLPIDSLSEERYNSLRSPHNPQQLNPFQKVLDAYKLCRRKNLFLSIETVITTQNFHELEDIIQFVGKHSPMSHAEIYPLFLSGRGDTNRDLLLTPQQLREFDRIRLNHYGDPCLFWDFTPFIPNLDFWKTHKEKARKLGITEGCTCCTEYIQMNYDGSVFPCSFLRINLGNILEEGLKPIWEKNPTVLKFRNRVIDEGKCKTCLYSKICGGCRARAFNETSNPFGSIPSCESTPDGHPLESIFTEKLAQLIKNLDLLRDLKI